MTNGRGGKNESPERACSGERSTTGLKSDLKNLSNLFLIRITIKLLFELIPITQIYLCTKYNTNRYCGISISDTGILNVYIKQNTVVWQFQTYSSSPLPFLCINSILVQSILQLYSFQTGWRIIQGGVSQRVTMINWLPGLVHVLHLRNGELGSNWKGNKNHWLKTMSLIRVIQTAHIQ